MPLVLPLDCSDIYNNDNSRPSGVYTIYPIGATSAVQVYCDMDSPGGRWTVFQRRMDGTVNFYRGWDQYKLGFGSAAGEYWLGHPYLQTPFLPSPCWTDHMEDLELGPNLPPTFPCSTPIFSTLNPHHPPPPLVLSLQDCSDRYFCVLRVSDLRWVQVNSSEEAYRVMKIGKKNQSFSSTRLNQLSSRSHSIFSIRILRVDDVGVPRVLGISELALCDLAGSERCSRTHNTGERLKEAGNINSSLLTLGKCINAMRLNQHAKFQHHIPFRESKLTHFLQFFFCGAGRVSMVVNINQNPSCFDETLNVLKFSALAQKVVVVNSRPAVLDDAPHRSAMELSIIIDEADQRRNVSGRGRKSSLVAWETTLEDVLEVEDDEEEEEEEESAMEGTVLEAGGEEDEEEEEDRTMEEEEKPDREAALRLVLEAQIREEVSTEFMELFNKMEKDYSERLEKEREILEERAEKRVEILKNLVSKTVDLSTVGADSSKEEQATVLEGIISSLTEDLQKVREDAQSVQRCLTEHAHAAVSPVLEEEISRLQEENRKKEETICELREREERRRGLEEELRRREEEVEELKKEQLLLEQNVQKLTDLDQCPNCASVFSSLESEQRETSRLTKENKALVNGIFQLQTEMTSLQAQLKEQTDRCDSLSEQLSTAKARLQDLESQSEEKANTISSLTQEVERLRRELKEGEAGQSSSSSSVFHATIEELKKEGLAALERSAQKSQQIQDLQREKMQLEETLSHRWVCRAQGELANQKAESSRQLQSLRAELESEGGALRGRLEEQKRDQETEKEELQRVASEKDRLIEESQRQTETLRKELERLQEELQGREEEEKENRQEEEEKVSVVEELKEELQRLQERKRGRQLKQEEAAVGRRSREFDAVHRELERLKEERERNLQQDVHDSPLRSNMADRKKTPRTTGRKRKSCEVEGLVSSENKRNRVRGNARNNKQEKRDAALQNIRELITKSPSILGSKAKNIISLVSGHSVEKETVTTATKPRRGRKKLYKQDASDALLDSPHMMSGGAEEEKESDHLIIKRQLRSKTCRK
ncbi:kinesin-like protein KIF20B [Micropterus salmoides]|uniref:kinesin-like protein KIF20B n=1 Tax=Micropterus salmoides TaxID=27706 RepID=UPI0018EE1F1B|nr:kinesin-like protein KIF20B [Micropterus salmoides]